MGCTIISFISTALNSETFCQVDVVVLRSHQPSVFVMLNGIHVNSDIMFTEVNRVTLPSFLLQVFKAS